MSGVAGGKLGDDGAAPFLLGRRPSFDGFRAIMVSLVIAVHATYALVPSWANRYVPGAFIGVDGFFVLSGFLITSLLIEEQARSGRIRLRAFYRRRALRLFPALWTVMIVQAVYVVVINHAPHRPEAKGLAAVFFFVGNFSSMFHATVPPQLSPTWSLAVEEQFYLLWPLILIGLLRLRRHGVWVGVFVGLLAIAFVSRLLMWQSGISWNEVYTATETRLDTLGLGALLAYLLHRGWRPSRRLTAMWPIAGLGLLFVVLVATNISGWMFDGGYTLVAFAFALVVLAAVDQGSRLSRVLSARPLRLLGRMSYSLYLWHYFVFLVVERERPGWNPGVRLFVGLGATLAVSALTYRLIEQPVVRYRRGAQVRGTPPAAVRALPPPVDLPSGRPGSVG